MSDGLDPIRRLHVLAAALPGVALVEERLDAPFDAVWSIAGDLEGGVPRFEDQIASVEVTGRQDERLRIIIHLRRGPDTSWNVLLRPGWCWMQSTRGGLLVGMAAVPEPDGRTRFAHAEGTRARPGGLFAPVLRRKIRKEIRIIERLARAEAGARGGRSSAERAP
jgi:hypothetical protein